jgi:hypothetical protein
MDLATAKSHLDAFLAADLAVATGQSYSIGSRTLTRANLVEIRGAISYWQRIVNQYTATAAGVRNPGVSVAKFT